jgi:hypothetical protein
MREAKLSPVWACASTVSRSCEKDGQSGLIGDREGQLEGDHRDEMH